MVVVPLVAVRLVMVAEAKVCCWVQLLPLPRFKEATTAPVVGEITRVPSVLETESTAPVPALMQVPPTAKQPPDKLRPLPKVEVAVEEAIKEPLILTLPAKVEEAEDTRPPVRVERLATFKEEEADKPPVIFKLLAIVEEPLTINPPRSVNRAASFKNPAFKVEKIKMPWAGSKFWVSSLVRAEVVQVEVAPLIWKARRFWELVAVWVLSKVKGMAGVSVAELEVKVVVAKEIVEEADNNPPIRRLPAIWKLLATVEEALETNPERLANPPTAKVEEADKEPVTFNWEEIVEEPLTIKPPKLVNLAASLKTPAFKVEKAKKPVPWP